MPAAALPLCLDKVISASKEEKVSVDNCGRRVCDLTFFICFGINFGTMWVHWSVFFGPGAPLADPFRAHVSKKWLTHGCVCYLGRPSDTQKRPEASKNSHKAPEMRSKTYPKCMQE